MNVYLEAALWLLGCFAFVALVIVFTVLISRRMF